MTKIKDFYNITNEVSLIKRVLLYFGFTSGLGAVLFYCFCVSSILTNAQITEAKNKDLVSVRGKVAILESQIFSLSDDISLDYAKYRGFDSPNNVVFLSLKTGGLDHLSFNAK